jgi:hypothetical protein
MMRAICPNCQYSYSGKDAKKLFSQNKAYVCNNCGLSVTFRRDMNEQLKQLFLSDPETGDELEFDSPPVDNGDGSYSFTVTNRKTGTQWKHTVRTEEV